MDTFKLLGHQGSQRHQKFTMTTATARLLLLVCTVAATMTCSWAFGVAGRTAVRLTRTSNLAIISPLFPSQLHRRHSSPLYFKAPPDGNVPESFEDYDDEDNDGDDEIEARGGILKILFISVPLFCKFCIVLVIKFLTDLVVYPLLWLYRLAHLTKIRILKFFGIDTTEKKSASSKGNT